MGEGCGGCRDWRGCRGYEWYSPGEVRFCWEQVKWLIEVMPLLREGRWPGEGKESGYVGGGRGRKKGWAAFETPAMIAGEIEVRLRRAGVSGKLLVAQVRGGEYPLEEEAKAALSYVAGWRRKRQSFTQWKADREYRRREGKR